MFFTLTKNKLFINVYVIDIFGYFKCLGTAQTRVIIIAHIG